MQKGPSHTPPKLVVIFLRIKDIWIIRNVNVIKLPHAPSVGWFVVHTHMHVG
jgi:hypothetical protein